ncbi:MAG: GNAT family N-acetyltransferase [Anaerolineales bacterium]
MITLSPMSDTDFHMFLRRAVPQYAYDQMRSGNWPAEQAAARAQQEFQQLLPQGPRTPGHFFMNILAEDTKVGMLWFVMDQSRAQPTAFLADFFIFGEFRNRGYGLPAMAALEEAARAQGAQRIEVQVFGHDEDAFKLYSEAGLKVRSYYMGKTL